MKNWKKSKGSNAKVRKKIPELAPSLHYLQWFYFALAVLKVFRQNENFTTFSGFEANSDAWTVDADLRKDIWTRTRDEWVKLTNMDFTAFPYRKTTVAKFYLRLRKKNEETLAGWQKELEAVVKMKG